MHKVKGESLLITAQAARLQNPAACQAYLECIHENIGDQISPDHWYEFPNEGQNPIAILAERLFPGDPLGLRKIGSLQVRVQTTKFHQFFMKATSPKRILPGTLKVWETLMTTGRTEMESTGQTSVICHLRDFSAIPKYYLEILHGSLEEMGRLMKLEFHITYNGSDPSDHRWQVEWKA